MVINMEITIEKQQILLPEIVRVTAQSTIDWVSLLNTVPQTLFAIWGITTFQQELKSKFGIILYANSDIYGPCVIKFGAPEYFQRYAHEKNFYKKQQRFPNCKLLAYSDFHHALLLEMVRRTSL